MRGGPTLDPPDWDEFRRIGHALVDEASHWLETVRERAVWQRPPAEVRERLSAGLPETGIGLEAALEAFRRDIFPYPLGNVHPRFWGWVVGSGDPVGILADFLASTMNPNVFAGDHAATLVEAQVLDWSRALIGLPPGGSGILTSGCAVANLIGLIIARHVRCPVDWAGDGLAGAGALPILYCSEETHNSIDKAARVMGLGANSLRRLPAVHYRLDVAALAEAVRQDVDRGRRPFCVVANVGTVNTGALDPIGEIADFCAEHGLWLHVDGAFGALAMLAGEYRASLAPLARADSVAFDYHKWMYAPYGVACLLTRHETAHVEAFRVEAAYLATDSRGVLSGRTGFGALGIELGRDFRALKIWLALKAHGRETFASLIEENIAQARHLARLVEAEAGLELVAPVSLNIVCFRAISPHLSPASLDDLNREIMLRLQESGVAILSSTRLGERFVLRAAITNHRSRREDFDLLVREILSHRAALLDGTAA